MLALWLWFPYGTMTAFKSSLKVSYNVIILTQRLSNYYHNYT